MLLYFEAFGFQRRSHLRTFCYTPNLLECKKAKHLKFALECKKETVSSLKVLISTHLQHIYSLHAGDIQLQLKEGFDLSDDIKIVKLPVNELRVLFVVGASQVQSVRPKSKKRKAPKEDRNAKKHRLFELVDSNIPNEEVYEDDFVIEDMTSQSLEAVVTDNQDDGIEGQDLPEDEAVIEEECQPQHTVQDDDVVLETDDQILQNDALESDVEVQPDELQQDVHSEVQISDVSSVSSVSTDTTEEDSTAVVQPIQTPVQKNPEVVYADISVPQDQVNRLPRLSDLKVQPGPVPGTPIASDESEAIDPEVESEASDSSAEESTNKQGLFALAKQQQKPTKLKPSKYQDQPLLQSLHPIIVQNATPPQSQQRKRQRKVSLMLPDKVPETEEEIMAILADDVNWE